MEATMQDFPLTLVHLFARAEQLFFDKEIVIVTATGTGRERTTYGMWLGAPAPAPAPASTTVRPRVGLKEPAGVPFRPWMRARSNCSTLSAKR